MLASRAIIKTRWLHLQTFVVGNSSCRQKLEINNIPNIRLWDLSMFEVHMFTEKPGQTFLTVQIPDNNVQL